MKENDVFVFVAYSFFFFASVAFSMLINSILLRFVKTPGTKNQPAPIVRWSSETKPAIGGLSFFIVFLFAFIFFFILFDVDISQSSRSLLGLISACILAFMMGLADDAYNTRPFMKFIVQVICGLCLFFSGSTIGTFHYTWLNGILTILWTVGIMNSINMLDNMDAIAAVVSAFIFTTVLIYMALKGMAETAPFALLLGTIATLLGFLFYNWHPSRIYMGDTGSQFLGVLLAYAGIHFAWNSVGADGMAIPSREILTVLLIFVLPISDTTSVVINRISRGKSPFVGGRDHTTHSLSYAGLSDSQVAFVYIGISLLSLCLSLYINNFALDWNMWQAGLTGLIFLMIFGALFALSRLKVKEIKDEETAV